MGAKEWFPPDPFPRKPQREELIERSFSCTFLGGGLGNRSLGYKERFPQNYLNGNNEGNR